MLGLSGGMQTKRAGGKEMKIRREKGRWRQAIAGILAAVLCTEWMPVPLVSAENFSQGEAVKAEMEMKEEN